MYIHICEFEIIITFMLENDVCGGGRVPEFEINIDENSDK